MHIRSVRRLVIAYFVLYAVMVTWPGVAPFREGRPFILGLPFPLAWATFWILGGLAALVLLDRAEIRAEPTSRNTGAEAADAPHRSGEA